MRSLDELFAALRESAFRRRFHLRSAEREYIARHGLPEVLVQAEELIARRLAPAAPPNDGRQTPWRGHPVFVAQHATATCCRGCLAKWHRIERGRELTEEEKSYIVRVLGRWLEPYTQTAPSRAGP